jgi:hypothetical protein
VKCRRAIKQQIPTVKCRTAIKQQVPIVKCRTAIKQQEHLGSPPAFGGVYIAHPLA